MGLSRTVSDTNGDFSRKSQIFSTHPVCFVPMLKAFSLELGTGALGQKKLARWAYRAKKEV